MLFTSCVVVRRLVALAVYRLQEPAVGDIGVAYMPAVGVIGEDGRLSYQAYYRRLFITEKLSSR